MCLPVVCNCIWLGCNTEPEPSSLVGPCYMRLFNWPRLNCIWWTDMEGRRPKQWAAVSTQFMAITVPVHAGILTRNAFSTGVATAEDDDISETERANNNILTRLYCSIGFYRSDFFTMIMTWGRHWMGYQITYYWGSRTYVSSRVLKSCVYSRARVAREHATLLNAISTIR